MREAGYDIVEGKSRIQLRRRLPIFEMLASGRGLGNAASPALAIQATNGPPTHMEPEPSGPAENPGRGADMGHGSVDEGGAGETERQKVKAENEHASRAILPSSHLDCA